LVVGAGESYNVVLLMLLAALACVAADSSAAAPDPGGFLGLKWSQPAGDCKKQVLNQ
jgi:hypothetical protein